MAYSDEVLADSPVLYFRLNETSGTTLDNLGSAGATGDATTNSTVVTATGLLSSESDPAQTFDSDAATYKATSGYSFSQEPLTVEFWIKPISLTPFGGANAAVVVSSAAATTGWSVSFIKNTGVWRFTSHSKKDYDFASVTAAQAGVTQHLAFVLDTDHDVSAYENGAFVEKVTHTAAPAATTEPFTINARTGITAGGRFTIDEVAVYGTALSEARLLAHHEAGTASNVTVTPTTASLTLATFAPTVTATANQTVTPGTASLTLATFAPTVTTTAHKTVTPDAASLSLTTFAPTVTTTGNQVVTPSPASLSLTAFAPTVVASDHKVVTPTTATLALTGFAPTVTSVTPFDWAHATSRVTLSAVSPATVAVGRWHEGAFSDDFDPDAFDTSRLVSDSPATVSISSPGSGVVTT